MAVDGPSIATTLSSGEARHLFWAKSPRGEPSSTSYHPLICHLIDVATTRAGDRSGDGFVVGSSPIRQVRHRHEGARFAYGTRPLALGATSLTLFRRTGKETFATLVYWFDARGVLTALEALAGGC